MKEKPSVLIVDDDENTCRTLKLIFDKKGYAADIARTGQEALEQARERVYNLILLDIKLPDMEGTELISPLKDICPDSNLIMVTAFASLESAVRALHEGAMAYVTKPLNMDEVLAIAKQALERQRLVMEKRRAEDALRSSEEKYRTILQSMNDLVFVVDKHDCLSQYYTSSEELLFISPKEFMGQHVSEVLPPSKAERFVKSFQRVRETGRSETFDYQLEIDGQNHWFSAVLSLHEDGESIVQVVRDVTRRKQAEEALRESEKKYRLLAENTSDCVWQIDLNTEFTYVNPAIFRVFGFTPEEWVGSSLSEHCSSEAMELMSGLMIEAIRTGPNASPVTFETRMSRKDGIEIDVEITADLILDEDQNPLGFQGTTRDITDRKRAERAIQRSEERFRSVFEESPVGINVFDSEGMLIEANRACLDVFGVCSVDDIEGFCLFDDPNISEELKGRIRDGETVRYQASFDFEKVKELGLYETSRSGIAYLNTVIAPLGLCEDGSLRGYIVQMQDVTERKIVEEALRASQQLLKRTFDSLSEAVLVLDADTTEIMDCNPAAETVFGYSCHELLGQKIGMLHVDELTYEEFKENLYPAIEEKGRLDRFEFRMKRRDGTIFPTEHSVTPLKSEQGTQVGWVSVVHDITERKRAQDALVGSEREKSAILNGMKDVVIYYDNPDMTIVWANRAAAESVNLSVDELIGKHCCKIWHQLDKSWDFCPVVRAFETGQPEEGETTTPDGRIWFIRGWPVKDDEGTTIGVVKVSRNVTEQKRAEEALRESEEWFRAIYEESPIAINVFDLDGNLVHANPALLNFVGVSSVEDLKDFNIFRDPNMPEDAIQRMRKGERVRFQSVIDYAKAREAGLYDTSKSGVSYVEAGTSPLKYGDDESLHGYMVQMVDATDRVLAEKKVRISEERYRGLVERMNEVVFRISVPDGKYEYMSPSVGRLGGYEAKEFLDSPLLIMKMVHPDSLEYFMGKWAEMVESKVDPVYEYKIIDTSGNTKWVSQSNAPVYDEKGNLIALEGNCRDITDRKKAEEDMRTAAETAMLYLDLMGHDIRNHLQAIIMGTEILEQLDIRPEVREMVDLVVDSVENSQNLIKKVQATRELLSVPLSSIPLKEALEDCLQVLNETYDDVQIEVDLAAQQPNVFADKYLGNLLMNILENAILHNDKKKKRIWLGLKEVEGGYEVVVADNGPGIDNDTKENLFDQSRRFGGVGVHQAFKIAQKYGGQISVQDRVPGDSNKGAEFHIWFPKSTA